MNRHATFVLLLSILCSLAVIHGCGSTDDSAQTTDSASATAEPRDSIVIELTGRDSVTVFDLLQRSHEVGYRSTALGVFVTTIDSIQGGRSAFWVFSVNDTMPKTASDKVFTRTGDRVRWHLRFSSQ